MLTETRLYLLKHDFAPLWECALDGTKVLLAIDTPESMKSVNSEARDKEVGQPVFVTSMYWFVVNALVLEDSFSSFSPNLWCPFNKCRLLQGCGTSRNRLGLCGKLDVGVVVVLSRVSWKCRTGWRRLLRQRPSRVDLC